MAIQTINSVGQVGVGSVLVIIPWWYLWWYWWLARSIIGVDSLSRLSGRVSSIVVLVVVGGGGDGVLEEVLL